MIICCSVFGGVVWRAAVGGRSRCRGARNRSMRMMRGGRRTRVIGRRDGQIDILLVDRRGVVLGLLGSGAENESGKGNC